MVSEVVAVDRPLVCRHGVLTRRSLLRGLLAAPAVVAASSLMPVRSIERLIRPHFWIFRQSDVFDVVNYAESEIDRITGIEAFLGEFRGVTILETHGGLQLKD